MNLRGVEKLIAVAAVGVALALAVEVKNIESQGGVKVHPVGLRQLLPPLLQ
jgi:hypothetical protein